jgi:hypothetical protein
MDKHGATLEELLSEVNRLGCYMDNNDPEIPYSLAAIIHDIEISRIRYWEERNAPSASGSQE